jgi:hypothetical protein
VKKHLLSVAVLVAGHAGAQDMPQTRLWLASLQNGEVGTPELISPNPGYNNQPRFSLDGSMIWYTGEHDGQTDVRYHRLDNGSGGFVAQSEYSEYSPTPIPGQNALAVVRVEADDKQRLWRIDLESGEFSLLFPNLEPAGYFAWIDGESVATFILGDTFDLYTARTGTAEPEKVLANIGRTLLTHPATGEILFVDQNTEPWQIAALEPATGQIRAVTPLFPGEQDFTVDTNGDYWTGIGSKLYRHNDGEKSWKLVADLSEFGVGDISRLAVNPNVDAIVLVGEN